MSSIFTKIINQEIPSFKIFEDDDFYSFLDINPLVKGHTLVVPKIEVDNIFDLSPELLATAVKFAQPIAKSIQKSFECNRCGISVIGLEVPHAHIHLVPLTSANDLNFTRKKLDLSEVEMQEIQKKIISNL